MEIEFGRVQNYNTARGFGFVSRTFGKHNRQQRNDIWFHITKIKYAYPDLAKELDASSMTNISFWYEIDNSDREKVGKVWLNSKDIPQQQQSNLFTRIEQIWCDADNPLPEGLEQLTIDLVGQLRKDELCEKRNTEIRDREELKKREGLQLKELQTHLKARRQAQSELIRERSQSRRRRRGIENVYVGLPEHLANSVLWVARHYRTNPLSHIPGGSDVVVEYHDGEVFGYDWIKMPGAYIRSFFAGMVGYESDVFKKLDEQRQIKIAKDKIARIFARKYKDDSERSAAPFLEVWTSESSNEMPWTSLERFEEFEYESEFETATEKADRLYGIPDPRLVED